MDPWWCPRWFPRTAVSLAREGETAADHYLKL